MAELSRESGVPVPTIKYYLREGLLPAGERTGRNQARYDEAHVRRLKLVRALVDIGGMTIAGVREVLDAIDEPEPSLHHVLGVAQHGLPVLAADPDPAGRDWAIARVEEVAAEHGWELKEDDPVVAALVGVLCVLRDLGNTVLADRLPDYADAAERLAEADLGILDGLTATESIVEAAVVGTMLGDAMLAALRRIAHQQASARRFET
ncbi:MerR family transcriptional regulator [Amycolatopsis antarctica]